MNILYSSKLMQFLVPYHASCENRFFSQITQENLISFYVFVLYLSHFLLASADKVL